MQKDRIPESSGRDDECKNNFEKIALIMSNMNIFEFIIQIWTFFAFVYVYVQFLFVKRPLGLNTDLTHYEQHSLLPHHSVFLTAVSSCKIVMEPRSTVSSEGLGKPGSEPATPSFTR